jgi:hypothetical protein
MVLHKTGTLDPPGYPGSIPGVGVTNTMKKKKRKSNYKAFLPLGMMFIVLGLTINKGFIGAGIVFLIIGFIHRNKK